MLIFILFYFLFLLFYGLKRQDNFSTFALLLFPNVQKSQ